MSNIIDAIVVVAIAAASIVVICYLGRYKPHYGYWTGECG